MDDKSETSDGERLLFLDILLDSECVVDAKSVCCGERN